VLLTGCLDRFEDGGALVNVFSTHHATPLNNGFPDRGEDNMPRVYDSQDGWQITLLESYVTIEAVTLVGCDGTPLPLNMFWGPCPEDLRSTDLDTLTVAGIDANPGTYCELQVTYGPYKTPVIDPEAQETQHEIPENNAIAGSTVYLRGAATKEGEETVQFELRSEDSVTVTLDLSEIDGPGAPMRINKDENFPKELTISKTYDQFLEGADWNNFDANLMEGSFDDVLDEQTRVVEGTVLDPENY
jgi:hypothetical protein